MTASLLPVRPRPLPGEPLTSFAVRLADANGVPRSSVLAPHRRDIDVPAHELAAIAALSGLDATDIAQLTMNRYPPSIRGIGPTHRGGWRLHPSVTWTCAGCTEGTGHTELLWQTALMPVCGRCRRHLVRGGQPRRSTPATGSVLDIVERLTTVAESAITYQSARNRLGRFRRLCASIAQTIDDAWPARPEGLAAVDQRAATMWGAFPCPDPGTVATIITCAAPALHSSLEQEQLAREALARRRGKPRRHPRKYLPKRPPPVPRRPILTGFTVEDTGRLRWLRTQLEHHATRHGLTADHVPALLPQPQDAGLPDPGTWATRWHGAIALHMLLTQTTGGAASSSRACTAFGTTDTDNSPLLDGIRLGRGIHEPDAAVLTDAVTALLTRGLVDYQRRRDTLRPITRMRRLPIPAAWLPEVDGYAAGVLALGWIWTRLTHGPMWTSPFPLVPDRAVRAFDAAADPEMRLALLETGQELLADADLVTLPTPAATWATVTRRYG